MGGKHQVYNKDCFHFPQGKSLVFSFRAKHTKDGSLEMGQSNIK